METDVKTATQEIFFCRFAYSNANIVLGVDPSIVY